MNKAEKLIAVLQHLGCREQKGMTVQARSFAHETEFDRYYFVTPTGGLFIGSCPSHRMAAHLDKVRLLRIAEDLKL